MLVKMTRRVAFSSGHRYWRTGLTVEENRLLFGKWASPFNHGHNYFLEVTVEGEVDPVTGMVVNIKRIDDLLRQRIVSQFDGKSINDEIPAFRDCAPTIENLLVYMRTAILDGDEVPDSRTGYRVHGTGAGSVQQGDADSKLLPGRHGGREPAATFSAPNLIDALPRIQLVRLRLEETPLLWGELDLSDATANPQPLTPAMTLTRTYEFAASHRLHSSQLSDEENVALYGKCNNAAGHGHNYVLEVTLGGEVDPATGMLADLDELDEVVKARVLNRYDHRNLDVDVPELQGKITTSEVVALEIFEQLDGHVPATLEKVKLFETARNAFEVSRNF